MYIDAQANLSHYNIHVPWEFKPNVISLALEFMEDITNAIDQADEVDVIYLDFWKAFDKVRHRRLLTKLKG